MAGILDLFGSNGGSAVPVVVIAPVLVPPDQVHEITEFDSTMDMTGTGMVVSIQTSNDGFVLNIVERARVEMPTGGSFLKTYDSAVVIAEGLSWRVIMVQAIPGLMSVRCAGQTHFPDGTPGTDVVG